MQTLSKILRLNLSDEKARYWFYWLYAITSRVGAILAISIKFDLFVAENSTMYKGIVLLCILLFWATLKFWKDFVEWARNMEDGFSREILLGIGGMGPYILLWGAGVAARIAIEDFVWITSAFLLFNMLGVVFGAEHMRLKNKILLARGHVRVIRK